MDYRNALVTGASRGIGAAISAALIREGITVHGLGRDGAALKALVTQLGPGFKPLVADVRDHKDIAQLLDGAEIDVLVNNAGGLSTVRPLQEQTADETDEVIALNLVAPLQLIRMLVSGMIERRSGHIFNLTSTAASAVFSGTTSYGAAKAGLSHAGRVLRYDLAGTGVRLTEIAPGRVETQFYLKAFEGDTESLREKMYKHQRPLHPDDIAAVLISALKLPSHVDVAEMIVAPSEQAAGGHTYPVLFRTE